MTKATNATAKDVASTILEELGVSMAYILDFEINNRVCLFERFKIPRRIKPGSELYARIQEIEQGSNVKVYAVTHDNLEIIGETYSFLCVSPHPEDWDAMLRVQPGSTYMVYAYVWNVADDLCSEFGYIAVCGGNLLRIG